MSIWHEAIYIDIDNGDVNILYKEDSDGNHYVTFKLKDLKELLKKGFED
jgi:hypothetical protein